MFIIIADAARSIKQPNPPIIFITNSTASGSTDLKVNITLTAVYCCDTYAILTQRFPLDGRLLSIERMPDLPSTNIPP